jgi:hypothetical protein
VQNMFLAFYCFYCFMFWALEPHMKTYNFHKISTLFSQNELKHTKQIKFSKTTTQFLKIKFVVCFIL